MKIRLLPLIAAFIAATPLVTSCLDSEEQQILYDPESSITGFSVGTLHIDRMGKDSNGEDSAYIDTINCSEYPFTIDQINRTIENKDSFPVGTYIDKVVTSITYDSGTGILVYRPKGSSNDTIWSSTDSIDFTEPLQFKVYMYSGSMGRPYTVKLNVHQMEPDTIAWKDFTDLSFSEHVSLDKQTALSVDKNIYVFGESNGSTSVWYTTTSSGNPSQWTELTSSVPADIITESAKVWNGKIYFLSGNDSYNLYSLDPATNQFAEEAGITGLTLLVAPDDKLERFYAVKDGEVGYFNSSMKWTSDSPATAIFGNAEGRISSYSEPLSYNDGITRTTILVNSKVETDSALVFQRLSSESAWTEIKQNQAMPNLENISMIHYDGKLYAFGGANSSHTAFDFFYNSTDNGLTWWKTTECMYFPETFKGYYDYGSYSATADSDNFIWIVWGNGNMSRGRINRLGFAPKW